MADNEAQRGAEGEDEDGASWREVFNDLRAGKTVEIPVGDDQEYKRRQRQLQRRAERQGVGLQITRDRGVLRAVLDPQAVPVDSGAVRQEAAATAGAAARERDQRREQRRAERGAGSERPSKEERRERRRAERAAGQE